MGHGLDSADTQRRLFKDGMRQEKHLVMEVINEEEEQRMERLKAERLKKGEE